MNSSIARRPVAAWLIAVASVWVPISPAMSDAEGSDGTRAEDWVRTGSGEPYETRVLRNTEGELSREDARQVSVLGSRIVAHINNAERALDMGDESRATKELELARELSGIVRDILPITTVTTEIVDADGNRAYQYQERVQNEEIPLYEGLANVEVIQPIVERKREQAAVQGFQLSDANLVRTSVLLDLGYAEGKIHRALARLDDGKPEQAQIDLLAASSIGVRFVTNEEDHPLVDAQAALRRAERQIRDDKYEAARANLEVAQVGLETYRTLVDDSARTEVSEMLDDIEALQEDVEAPDAAERIREHWNALATWFEPEPRQARATIASGRGSR